MKFPETFNGAIYRTGSRLWGLDCYHYDRTILGLTTVQFSMKSLNYSRLDVLKVRLRKRSLHRNMEAQLLFALSVRRIGNPVDGFVVFDLF